MSKVRTALALITSIVIGTAQLWAESKEEYDAFVNETKEAVFGMDLPAFEVRDVPERYKDESAVYVAMYVDIDARKKTGFGHLPGTLRFSRKARVEGGELFRMLILLNDRAALDRFSEFDFATDIRKKMSNAHRQQRLAMGARVIKPDGRVVDVNTDDYVDVEEGIKGRDRRRKLAVPGLEVGDMLDIFFYTEHKLQNVHLEPFLYGLRDEYAIMDYQIHAVVDDNLTTQYRTLNGAPDFNVSRDEDNNYVLDLHATDLPAEPDLWYNQAAQSPLVLLHVFNRRSDAYTPPSARTDGLQANPPAPTIINDVWAARADVRYYLATRFINDKIKNGGKAYKNIGRLLKEGKIDSLEAGDYVYNLLTAAYLLSGEELYQIVFDIRIRELLTGIMEPSGVVSMVTTEVGAEPLDSLISMYNTTNGQMICGGKRIYLPPRGVMAPSELPSAFDGRKAQIYNTKKYRKNHPEADTTFFTLPQTTADDNRNVTTLNIKVDGSTLDVSRRESMLGSTKSGFLSLFTDEEIIDAYLAYLSRYGVEVGLKEKAKMAADRAGRNATAKDERVDEFKAELDSYHRGAAEYVDGRVVSLGIDPASPEMIYEIDYKLNGLVKRAGTNMILSVGRLLSPQMEVTDRERERHDDAMMTVPREYVTDIEIAIPAGYKVSEKSLGELRRTVSNEVGSFSSDASVSDGILKVVVTKRYDVGRIPVAQWQSALNILDAAFDWHSQTVMLEN